MKQENKMDGNLLSHKILTCLILILTCLTSLSTGNYPLLDVDTNMRIVLIPYDTPVGTIIYRLKASDSDNNFPLAFEVLGSVGKSLLSLEFLGCSVPESLCQADVLLNKPLDEGRTYEFKLRVRDTTGDYTQVPAVITATTSSVSSNAVFGTKILTIPEDTHVGTMLDKFVVIKNDMNARVVVLELRDKEERIELKQRLLSNNRTEGTLFLKKPLDFEREPWFTTSILVMNAYTNTNVDTRNVLVSEVIVAVQDIQDTPPEFEILPSYVEIPKTIQKGDLITRVTAVDGDKKNKRLIRYGFLTDSNPFVSFFELDQMTGEITLKRDVSQLSTMARPNEPIRMTIIAEEIIPENELSRFSRGSAHIDRSSAQATITFWLGPGVVTGPPRFSSDLYVTEVKEDSVIGTSLPFTQEPRIWYENTDELVALTFGSPNSSGNGRTNDTKSAFEIVPREGRGNFSFEIRLLDPKMVDFETVQQIKHKLIATTSSGMVALSDITCYVRDANDHGPIFTQKEYRVELPENAPIGTRVVQVHAVDKDAGNNGRVVYTSLVGSDAFRLDAVTGEITVDKSILDREEEPEIRLYVEAKDGGYTDAGGSIDGGFHSVRNVASATVVVTLIDHNDNAPVFNQKYYHAILSPDMSSLKHPVRITADDLDSDGPNSLVRYQLTPDSPRQFSIDQMTGELKLRSQFKPDIQNQDGLYLGSLKVRAFDSGSPQLYSETLVQIFSKEVLSRQLQFVLPSKPLSIENNRKRIENMLSSLTGGQASIKDIRLLQSSRSLSQTQIQQTGGQPKALHDNQGLGDDSQLQQQEQQQQQLPPGSQSAAARGAQPEKTLVTAEVTYPISSIPPVIDLDAFQKTYMASGELNHGDEGVHKPNGTSDRQIELFRAENQMLFWLLIAFILLLLLLFVIFLCCIFCPCCYLYTYCKRYDKRREVIQELDVDQRGDRRGRKTHPSRIEEEPGEYNNQSPTGYRREAWSGADNRQRRGGGAKGTMRRSNQQQGQGPHGRNQGNNVEGDVALEDWEFNEHGAPMRNAGDPRAEEIGPRWQQQHGGQQQNNTNVRRNLDNVVTDGFASRRPVQNNNVAEADRSSEPGNNTYLMQRLNHLPPGARPYPANYYPPPRSTSHSLPPTEAQIRSQTRPTRFYRTEAGEVLQLDDYEGDEGKEMLMRRFISEQEPQNGDQGGKGGEKHQQQPNQAGPANYDKRRLHTPAAIVPPRQTLNNELVKSHDVNNPQTDVKWTQYSERPSKEQTPANSTTTIAERPKAAVVSRRSRDALDGKGDKDVEFGIIDDDEDSDRRGRSGSPSPVKGKSKSKGKGKDRRESEEHLIEEGHSRRRRERDRDKSRSRSHDSQTLSPKTTTLGGKSKTKSKSNSKSRSRSKSPLIVSKSRHKSPSRSPSRTRSQSGGSLSPPPHQGSKSKSKGDRERDRYVRKSQKKVPKGRRMDEEKTVAAVTAAAASVVAKRKSLEQSLSPEQQELISSMNTSGEDNKGYQDDSYQDGGEKKPRGSVIAISVISPSSAKTDSSYHTSHAIDAEGGGASSNVVVGQHSPNSNLVMVTSAHTRAHQNQVNNNNSTINSNSTTIANRNVVNVNEQNYYESQYQEEDGDSGIGIMATARGHNMLVKKSVFTIAYDDMASQKVLRPDTARPGTMEAL